MSTTMKIKKNLRCAAIRRKVTFRGIPIALGGLLILTACHKKSAAPAMPPPEVAVITVTPEALTLIRKLPGRTAPYRIAEIRPQVNGLILKRLFTEGENVEAGQELYQIDPAHYEAALKNAEAALGRSEANLPALRLRADRFKEALAEKAVSQQDYDDADAALKQAEADVQYWKAMVETARINVDYTKVTSPISGRIGISAVTEGAIVTAYQSAPLTTIQQLDPIYVDVPQSAAELLRLQKEAGSLKRDGDAVNTVQLLLFDGSEYPHKGTLQFRDISVDPSTGTVTLRMVFPNPDGVLLPGMFVRAVLVEGVAEESILVPQSCVLRNPKGEPYVFLVNEGNTVEQRPVEVESAPENRWRVMSGLHPGERVIVEGRQRVRPGAPVRVTDWAPEASTPETAASNP